MYEQSTFQVVSKDLWLMLSSIAPSTSRLQFSPQLCLTRQWHATTLIVHCLPEFGGHLWLLGMVQSQCMPKIQMYVHAHTFSTSRFCTSEVRRWQCAIPSAVCIHIVRYCINYVVVLELLQAINTCVKCY